MTPTDVSVHRLDELLKGEWLVTNHVGGYASSTIPALNTRKYHGLLVAAMSPPVRRLVLLSRVEEVITCDGWPTPLACNEYPGTIHPDGWQSQRASILSGEARFPPTMSRIPPDLLPACVPITIGPARSGPLRCCL